LGVLDDENVWMLTIVVYAALHHSFWKEPLLQAALHIAGEWFNTVRIEGL
jgi:hypothetical protein